MNAEKLNEIKERAEKATSGPWKVYKDGDFGIQIGTVDIHPQLRAPNPIVTLATGKQTCVYIDKDDAEFIAHAREDIPALVAEVERLRSVIWRISSLYDISVEETSEFLAKGER